MWLRPAPVSLLALGTILVPEAMKLIPFILRLSSLVLFLLPEASRAQVPASSSGIFADVPQEDIRSAEATFALFDPQFYNNQLFLLGEAHGVQRPQELDLALLKHLNQRAGVRTYVAEVDVCKAYYLNQYLLTGQDSLLQRVFRSWLVEYAQWGNQDFYQKVQQIRAWNETLPVARRIRFIGLDELQDLPLAAAYTRTLLGKHRLPAPLQVPLDSVMLLLRGGQTELLAGVGVRTLRELAKKETPYRRRLGAAYDELTLLLTLPTGKQAWTGKLFCLPISKRCTARSSWRTRSCMACGVWHTCCNSPSRMAILPWLLASGKAHCPCTIRLYRCCACSASVRCYIPWLAYPLMGYRIA